jgi:hypothetical protein
MAATFLDIHVKNQYDRIIYLIHSILIYVYPIYFGTYYLVTHPFFIVFCCNSFLMYLKEEDDRIFFFFFKKNP